MNILLIKYAGGCINIGEKVPIRKRRYISISYPENGTEKVIAYFTKDGEKIFQEFLSKDKL